MQLPDARFEFLASVTKRASSRVLLRVRVPQERRCRSSQFLQRLFIVLLQGWSQLAWILDAGPSFSSSWREVSRSSLYLQRVVERLQWLALAVPTSVSEHAGGA
jgi:hypothetical protein